MRDERLDSKEVNFVHDNIMGKYGTSMVKLSDEIALYEKSGETVSRLLVDSSISHNNLCFNCDTTWVLTVDKDGFMKVNPSVLEKEGQNKVAIELLKLMQDFGNTNTSKVIKIIEKTEGVELTESEKASMFDEIHKIFSRGK